MSGAVIDTGFWSKRLAVNSQQAIFHQWEQLVKSGCIENFRIAAGLSDGLRVGWFFADSDAYKWLEAACRIHASSPDARLAALIDDLIDLLARAQAPDGYLFTYNQIHFPTVRWQNLQIEHELYCHGHLIEAGVSHYETSGRDDLLAIARRAADRIVADFRGKGPAYTPGHEEIEIALLRLHQVTPGDQSYYEMARQFLEQRGRTPLFAFSLLRQNTSVSQRARVVAKKKQEYLNGHPGFVPFQLPPGNPAKKPANSALRWYLSALSGKYFQQHTPVRRQTTPVGHCVRFAYLETATAMLARLSDDHSLVFAIERAWERMVTRRMFVTGGIGSQPGLEGFGNDYELDPEYAYAETCAALASLFWNWEMAQLSSDAKYSDLFEWQLYNAAAVGMGLDGTTYLYNNPLASRGDVERRAWYAVPCCPSNISRTWANLGKYIVSSAPGQLFVQQYIGSVLRDVRVPLDDDQEARLSLTMESDLPWDGRIYIKIADVAFSNPNQPAPVELHLRRPSWASSMQVVINGEIAPNGSVGSVNVQPAGSGFDPHLARFQVITRYWAPGDRIEINIALPIYLRRAHPKVKGQRGQAAVTRGPLVYCLEDADNPGVNVFTARLDPDSLVPVYEKSLLDGIIQMHGKTKEGGQLTFIPYFLWGNRGPSQMTVWVNT